MRTIVLLLACRVSAGHAGRVHAVPYKGSQKVDDSSPTAYSQSGSRPAQSDARLAVLTPPVKGSLLALNSTAAFIPGAGPVIGKTRPSGNPASRPTTAKWPPADEGRSVPWARPKQTKTQHGARLPQSGGLQMNAGLSPESAQRKARRRKRFQWPWEVPKPPSKPPPGLPESRQRAREVLKLTELGSTADAKALRVNLLPDFYGSFAEIGAGQEVSRTFLRAGAAAGTVAKSLSAYDMQMSNAMYGTAKRYVTRERLLQMMDGEYNELEKVLREGNAAWGGKGPDVRFFGFASTLAAKAYMSDRECEGWVGLKYQHEAGAEPSVVSMHIRMSDPTAAEQGEAVGRLGTNLIYLCSHTNDPYAIAGNLQDGIAKGRLEVDVLDCQGPAFGKNPVDPRILALRMIQSRSTPYVMLEPDAQTGGYRQAVPNDALYKTPVIVEKSRFFPLTRTHQELMEAANRQVSSHLSEDGRSPKNVFNLLMDDLMRPEELDEALIKLKRIAKYVAADADGDGYLTHEQLRGLLAPNNNLSPEDISEIVSALDRRGNGFVEIDSLASMSLRTSTKPFCDRLEMLRSLNSTVLVSANSQDFDLAEYLARYTKEQVSIVLGGYDFKLERSLYKPETYDSLKGGRLEGIGRLFANNVKVLVFPLIDNKGKVSPPALPQGPDGFLHKFFLRAGNIVPISGEHISEEALAAGTNLPFRGSSVDVIQSILAGDSEWEKYVSPEVAKIVKTAGWLGSTQVRMQLSGGVMAPVVRFIESVPI